MASHKIGKDTAALEAAKAFVEKVVSVFGLHPNLTLHSDEGSADTSNFFRSICSLLNVRLITSTSQISQSNGQA
jgi:transposase InsO family protein